MANSSSYSDSGFAGLELKDNLKVGHSGWWCLWPALTQIEIDNKTTQNLILSTSQFAVPVIAPAFQSHCRGCLKFKFQQTLPP